MSWEDVLRDIEASAEADERRELLGEVADRTRRELARLHLVDRLRAATGSVVTLGVGPAGPATGRMLRVGPDWLLLDTGPAEVLVVPNAILWVGGLSPRAVDPAAVSAVDRRLALGSVLRAVARDRRVVTVTLRDGGNLRGVVRRVGADFFDVTPARRAGQHGSIEGDERCLPFAALAVVRLA